MKKLTKLMLVLAQLGLVGAVQAGTISLSPVSKSVTAGNTVTFDVMVDFTTTPTIGGYFKLDYSASTSLLSSASFTPNASFISDNGLFAYTPTPSTGYLDGLGFAGAFSGSGTLGTVTFTTSSVGAGNTQISLLSYPDDYTATFYNFRNSGGSSYLTMNFVGATAQVSAVPVPAALWLMASGLSALGLGMRRRRA